MGDLSEEIRACDARARHHKREARRHRELARAARQKQAELEAQCRNSGIRLQQSGPRREAGA